MPQDALRMDMFWTVLSDNFLLSVVLRFKIRTHSVSTTIASA